MPYKYNPSKHEVIIGNNYNLKMLDSGNIEVPIILKCRHKYLETENPEYRNKTDNQFLQLNFMFDNGEDAETLYNLLKKGTLKRVQRHTGRFKEEESIKINKDIPTWRLPEGQKEGKMEMTLEDYPKDRIIFDENI